MTDYNAKPIIVSNATQSNNVAPDTLRHANFLPAINRSESLERFFASTVDQLLSSGSTQSINAYWGRLTTKSRNTNQEMFMPEISADRINYQFAPGTTLRRADHVEKVTTYANMLSRLATNGSDLINHDRLFSEPGYVLDLPIDADMFVNYGDYYWLEGNIPLIVIEPTEANPVDIDTITSLSHYTTPILTNGKTVEFITGLRIKFVGTNVSSSSGDFFADYVYYVENVGGSNIKFVPVTSDLGVDLFPSVLPYTTIAPEGWDTVDWDTTDWDGASVFEEYSVETINTRDDLAYNKSYIVMERWASDSNPWARGNRWFSKYAIAAAAAYNGTDIRAYMNDRTRATRNIIEYNANMELVNTATRFVELVNYAVTSSEMTNILSGVAELQVTGEEIFLADGDIILVNSPAGTPIVLSEFTSAFSSAFTIALATYTADTYVVSGVGTLITITPLTTYNAGDFAIVKTGVNAGTIYNYDGSDWSIGQNKDTIGTAPLFELYTHDFIALSDFDNTDFVGCNIFDYARNGFGLLDRELGFAPAVSNISSINDFKFDFSLSNAEYFSDITDQTSNKIHGLYYWKDRVTSEHYNGWSNIRGGQRVPITMTAVSDGLTNAIFNVDTIPSLASTTYAVIWQNGAYRWIARSNIDDIDSGSRNPDIIMARNTDYTIDNLISDSANNIEFVDPYGNTDGNISVAVANNVITISVATGYSFSKIRYQSITDVNIFGEIVLVDTLSHRVSITQNEQLLIEAVDYVISNDNIEIITVQKENDVIVLTMVSDADMTNAVYDVAPVHFYNNANELFSEVTYSSLARHLATQLHSMPGYEVTANGNNYHKSRIINQYGGLIRQQQVRTDKFQHLNETDSCNPIKALQTVSSDYATFKRHFKNKTKQLWTSRTFNSVRDLVDQALVDINVGKNSDFRYAYSDMAYFRNYSETTASIADSTTTFVINNTKNTYGVTQNHIQVWLTEYDGASQYYTRSLINETDYTFVGNTLELANTVILNGGSSPATLVVRWYDSESISHIPYSSVKLGFSKPYAVEIVDGILFGHDGSEHVLSGSEIYDISSSSFDVVTAALYDLELRIANNLTAIHDTSENMIEYIPNAHNNHAYSIADMNVRLDDWYNRYAIKNSLPNIIDEENYSVLDPFTWNYSSVGPGIGGWRAVYAYYFGTIRPDTHPWEMLGHYRKPTWWDTHYSWNTGAKRVALLNALRTGIVGNPSDGAMVDINYSRNAYNWSTNVLVTTSGVLNDPVDSGVVSSPAAIDASRKLVFGDWGNTEHIWRASSEYKFAIAEVLLQLKPYRIYDKFWNLGRSIVTDATQTQIIDAATWTRARNNEIHNLPLTGGIIKSITVKAGGSGYVDPTIVFQTNDIPGFSASATVYTTAGAVTAVSVNSTGRDFIRAPTEITITDTAGSGAIIAYNIVENTNVSMFGFSAITSELFSNEFNNTLELADMLNSLTIEYSLHVGGFTDDRIIQIEIPNTGNSVAFVPQNDYDIILAKSAPIKSVFFSGVKITKDPAIGYTVSGYDLDSMYFYSINPSKSGTTTTETINGSTLIRYLKFQNTTSKISYGNVFKKRQDLFTFLIGLGEYYKTIGFVITEDWINAARAAVAWTFDEGTDAHYMSGFVDSITYEQGQFGIVQSIDTNYSSTATILNSAFSPLVSNAFTVLRSDTTTEFASKTTERIFGLKIQTVSYEHLITLQNVSSFADILYSPIFGLAHPRIKIAGERTANWQGKVEAPGYLVQDTGLILNVESSVRELETDWVNSETKALDRLTRQTLGFNVGYNKPTYLTNTAVSDISAYRFEKGKRKYKGTLSALTAISRNNNIFGTNFESVVNEEWLVRLGDYGDISAREPLQIQIDTGLIKSDSQQFRFSDAFINDSKNDLIIDIYKGSQTAISGNFDNPFATVPLVATDTTSITSLATIQGFNKDAGLPLVDEIDYFLANINNISDVFDITADYALIRNWNSTNAYHKDDVVRHEGKVYKLLINSTGLTPVAEGILIRATQVFPIVSNGQTVILNDNTVTFSKTTNNNSNLPITLVGSVLNPIIPSNSSLIIDGITVNLVKNTTVTVYNDIIIDGSVIEPIITNGPTTSVVISYANTLAATLTDITVDFNALSTTKTMQQIWIAALNTASVPTPTTYANTIIANLGAFQAAYIGAETIPEWETLMGLFFASGSPNMIFNPEVIGAAVLANPGAAWETTARDLIDTCLVLIELLSGNAATETQATMVSGSLNNSAQFDIDRDAANTLLDAIITGNDDNINLANFIGVVIGNGSISIAPGTVITISAPTDYVVDALAEIVIKINDALTLAGVTDIAAGAVASALRLTRSPSLAGYRLGVSTSAAFGFIASDNDVPTTGNVITSDVNLTVAEAVNLINNATISGVAATVTLDDQLSLTSVNSNVTITSSSLLAIIGISSGTTPAAIVTTTIEIDLTISDIVQQINSTSITNLAASQVEGALILTYAGSTLVIGDGTANTSIGLAANTYTASTDVIENVFDANNWAAISEPADFNIWIIDNIGSNPAPQSVTNRYNVYQTLDFEIGIVEICAGVESGDNALIECSKAHNLDTGEYVLILNTSSVPSADGIYKVSGIKGEMHFFIDRYIDQKGFAGKVIPLRQTRFANTAALSAAINSVKYKDGVLGIQSDHYVYVDDVEINNSSSGAGAVYSIVGTTPIIVRNETPKTSNRDIKNGILFVKSSGDVIHNYEIVDPLKGLIPGIADIEIDIRNEVDIAGYNNTTDINKNVNFTNSWGRSQVGLVWWDLSNAIYLNYDQGPSYYRQLHWGELFPTSTIDVYEWTKSPVTPDEYENAVNRNAIIDGVELTGNAYVTTDIYGDVQYYWTEEIELNKKTNRLETYYYFWVKNKSTVPNIERLYSISQIADIILDPAANGVTWCAASSDNTLLVSSLVDVIGRKDLILQLNFAKTDIDYHQEFVLLSPTDSRLEIPEWLFMGLRDSLAGFTRIERDVEYTVYDNLVAYAIGDIVKSGINFYKCHVTITGTDPETDTLNAYWTAITPISVNPTGYYAANSSIVIASDIAVPDVWLHEYVRYGISIRPRQSWIIDKDAGRKAAVAAINMQFENVNLIDSNIGWYSELTKVISSDLQDIELTQFWDYIDWNKNGVKFVEIYADYRVASKADLASINAVPGNIAIVLTSNDIDNISRKSAYMYVDGAWDIIYKEKATIAFNNLLWDDELTQSGWDVNPWDIEPWDQNIGAALHEILNSLHNVIWVNEQAYHFTAFWFAMATYILTEQNEVDWLFKSSYISYIAKTEIENKNSEFFNQNIDEMFDYINAVKPFRTKLKDAYVESSANETCATTVNDTAEIRIQTNPADNTTNETTTRSFRLTVGSEGSAYSSQIVNEHKKLLAADISATDTIIPILNFGEGTIPETSGAVWIGGERIIYAGTYANTLLLSSLVSTATVTATDNISAGNGILMDIASITTALNITGTTNAFCIDFDGTINDGVALAATVIIADPDDVSMADYIVNSANLCYVNYIINQDYIAQGYTLAEIQDAIWYLTDDYPSLADPNVLAIVTDALTNGIDYVPGVGDLIGVIIAPIQEVDGFGVETTNYQNFIYGVRYDLLTVEWFLKNAILLTGCVRGTQNTFNMPHSFTDIVEDMTNLEFTIPTTLSDFANDLNTAWTIPNESMLSVTNTDPIGTIIRNEAFGTVDAYGNLMVVQIWAQNLLPDALETLSAAVSDTIETYLSTI
jgi:hypothetical protein